jgi:plastocyanin
MTVTQDRPPAGDVGPSESADRSGGGIFYLAFIVMTALMVVALLGVVVLAAIAIFNEDSAPATTASATELDVQLTEFAIEGELASPAGPVTLNIVNAGAIEHNVAVRELGVQSRNITSRGVDTLDLGELEEGTYELYCTISGHEESGMHAELVVGGDAAAEAAAEAGGEANMTPAQMDQAMIESMLAFPTETEGVGNPILEPEILPDGTKKFTLVAEVTPWEVSPGEFVDAWTYNGVVPGPQIAVDVGDKVQVELTNLTPLGTDIHWHGIHTPNSQDGVSPYTQDPIPSGETYTYEFVAEDPAIGMYHAHLHSQTSVVNGMFAAFTIGENPLPRGETFSGIEIPADLEPAFEEPMVLNDAGVIGLTLNGKSFPATEPIVMNEGEWGVLHYYNEGLTAHPMHLHQFPQLVYAKDGIPLDHPYWADTINVAPGERYSVLFQADTAGTWVYHCHILTHVERAEGMFGMVTAVVVNPAEASEG